MIIMIVKVKHFSFIFYMYLALYSNLFIFMHFVSILDV